MSKRKPVAPRLAAIRPLALIALCAGSGTAFAQSSPWHIGVSQGFAHQTNLFGAPSPTGGAPDSRVADKYSITSLLGGVDLKLSRQRVFANGVVRANRYEDVKRLDNDSYGLNLGLDWETVNDLSGTLRASGNRSLASYTIPGAPSVGQEKNIETSNQTSATVRYGITSRFALTGGWQRRDVEFSSPAFRTAEYTMNEVSAGLRYGLPSLLVFGLGVRNSTVDRPRYSETPPGSGSFLGDETDRRDIDFTIDWSPSALSTINARLSYGKEDHSVPTVADSDGTTGSLTWSYRPSDKTGFALSLGRDTGSSVAFLPYSDTASPLQTYSTRLTNFLGLSADYEATAKIRLNASLRHTESKSDSASGQSKDKSAGVSLGASYAYSRAISFNCGVSHDKRETATADVANRTVNCTGQLTLR
jgi:hypothetical protein